MNIALMESAERQKYNAGSKARQDVLKIVTSNGYKHIVLFHNGKSKPVIILEIIRGCYKAMLHIKKGERLLIQYPYSPMILNRMIFFIIRIGQIIKTYDVSVLIHDLPGLRNSAIDNIDENFRIKSELQMMKGCNIIYHNEKMRDICERIYPASSYHLLGPFDYIYSGEICKRVYSNKPIVMIAGNLLKEKCGYVYQLHLISNVRFNLFGAGYVENNKGNVCYRGKYNPEELIIHLDGQFGLIWDGDSIQSCVGCFGQYLKYNSPHKFSLYLAAGAPVIVWKESALAEYVEKNKIGICVQDLRELSLRLSEIDKTEYDKMVINVMRIRDDIIHGRQLLNALQKVD